MLFLFDAKATGEGILDLLFDIAIYCDERKARKAERKARKGGKRNV